MIAELYKGITGSRKYFMWTYLRETSNFHYLLLIFHEFIDPVDTKLLIFIFSFPQALPEHADFCLALLMLLEAILKQLLADSCEFVLVGAAAIKE